MRLEERLSEVLPEGTALRSIEPHVYSLSQPGENTNAYDSRFGAIYDIVACNRLYNRVIWGYRTSLYHRLCLDALEASDGWILDVGCGSLAFTAKAYAASSKRPVVLLDQSVNLLRRAKARLVQEKGAVPANMLFLHGDALQLPFKERSFTDVLAVNLLHVLHEPGEALRQFRRVLAPGGALSCTTLVKSGRLADRYLDRLARAGMLQPRRIDQVLAFFDGEGMPHRHRVEGNLATVTSTRAP